MVQIQIVLLAHKWMQKYSTSFHLRIFSGEKEDIQLLRQQVSKLWPRQSDRITFLYPLKHWPVTGSDPSLH